MRTSVGLRNTFAIAALLLFVGCQAEEVSQSVDSAGSTANDTASAKAEYGGSTAEAATHSPLAILSNPANLAICYGGFRGNTRENVPSVAEIKEDVQILSAMGVKLLRTYNTQQFAHARNLLEAISEIKANAPDFEMYVMLGAWIDCKDAWTDAPDHDAENEENNRAEIDAAIELTNRYPETVKVIAVGNEAMVHWATNYFVRPRVIHRWVAHLQAKKLAGELPSDVWITSSDNYAAWGGADASYHTDELTELLKAVDYVSLHTYPFHDTHYNSEFWNVPASEQTLGPTAQADAAMKRAVDYARDQYATTARYIRSLGIDKRIHIGETGWASADNALYGQSGSGAADEYKAKLFYDGMRRWTSEQQVACFYFEAFDEYWKDENNVAASENHFGLFTIDGKAKYALWNHVDSGNFSGLTRDGNAITKSLDGSPDAIKTAVLPIPLQTASSGLITTVNESRSIGQSVTEDEYLVVYPDKSHSGSRSQALPSMPLKLNVWESTCGLAFSGEGVLHVTTGTGKWWGCGLEIQGDGLGENLERFADGHLNFEIRGHASAAFELGFQTGSFTAGTQSNNFVAFSPDANYKLGAEWRQHSIAIKSLDRGADLTNVTGLLYVRGENGPSDAAAVDGDAKSIYIRNVFYTAD